MMVQSGNTIKRKPQQLSHEMNPDPIKDDKDLAEFSKLLAQEKLKKLSERKEKVQ